jgi:hypothetical protein
MPHAARDVGGHLYRAKTRVLSSKSTGVTGTPANREAPDIRDMQGKFEARVEHVEQLSNAGTLP